MSVNDDYLKWVLGQLSAAERVSSRRMFGGVGLYRDAVFFAIIAANTLYFKVDDANRAAYVTRGMPQFRPHRDKPQLSMSYYEVPADVLEDAEECVRWAMLAIAAAAHSKPSRKRRTSTQ